MPAFPQRPRAFKRRSVLAGLLAAFLGSCHGAQGQAEIITNVAAVRALSPAEAAEARPVHLRGVVIDRSDPKEHAVIVADDTGGIYALSKANLFAPYQRGVLLELTGVTDPGEFAPIVKVSKVHQLGIAPLPAPQLVTYHQLMSGTLDAQWVELNGVVQQYLLPAKGSEIRRIVLSVDGNPVHIRITNSRDPNLQPDAEVQVQALCFYQFNQKRQLLSPILAVPVGIPVIVKKPAPADPFAAPVRTADSFLQFSPESQSGHRVHVRGIVTHSQKPSVVWIRDASSGLRLQAHSPEIMQPGNVIDVLGFPKFGDATPILDECIFQKLGTTNPPAPLNLTNPTNAYDHVSDLVSLEATLKDIAPILEGVALTLQTSGTVFKAVLKMPDYPAGQFNWQPGSRVRVAGICAVTYDDTHPLMGIWHPQSFQLMLRSPDDLTILQSPPWWTLKHVTYVLGAVTIGLILLTSVITLLSRRRLLEQQRHRAMAEAEFAAILSERNRMAREIHDTLAQGLTATSFQLRLAKKRAAAADTVLNQHLDTAQELVRGSLAEARGSIWNMRSQVLETHDLAGALENILKQMVAGSDCQTSIKVTGHARRLAPLIENNLVRLGQEAITNAVRHAGAGQINVRLDFEEKQLCLSIRDDGGGFDTSQPPKSSGGFGLVGMRERAKEVNGKLEILSTTGTGSEIILTIPLPEC